MRIETTLALLPSVAYSSLLQRIRSCCDDGNISYDVMILLKRSLFKKKLSHIILE